MSILESLQAAAKTKAPYVVLFRAGQNEALWIWPRSRLENILKATARMHPEAILGDDPVSPPNKIVSLFYKTPRKAVYKLKSERFASVINNQVQHLVKPHDYKTNTPAKYKHADFTAIYL